jgi:3-phenylpropionate/cinnamic acid dioxygenase small subunit
MASSEVQITNLLFRYAELIDAGDFPALNVLFQHAQIDLIGDGGETQGRAGNEVGDMMAEQVMLYEDGTPRTKHVITNPIVEVDEEAGTGECRSYYTVFQRVDADQPLQPIITGRYVDRFERVDGTWRWSYRDYSKVEQVGDLSRHLKRTL